MIGKKIAFTLSELLLALGILGIVAAMTIPSLSGRVQTKALSAQVKNTVAEIEHLMSTQLALNNARTLADTDFRNLDLLFRIENFPIAKTCTTASECWTADYRRLSDNSNANNIILGSSIDNGRTVKLKNGTIMTYNPITSGYSNMTTHPGDKAYGMFRIDVNGDDGPNAIGRDVFWFIVSQRGKIYDYYTFKNQSVPADATIKTSCRDGSILYNCLHILKNNNWIMDY